MRVLWPIYLDPLSPATGEIQFYVLHHLIVFFFRMLTRRDDKTWIYAEISESRVSELQADNEETLSGNFCRKSFFWSFCRKSQVRFIGVFSCIEIENNNVKWKRKIYQNNWRTRIETDWRGIWNSLVDTHGFVCLLSSRVRC